MRSHGRCSEKAPGWSNAVHLSGAALRSTGYRVLDIFTALGLDGLGHFFMNSLPMLPRSSFNLRGVCEGDNTAAITTKWLAINWQANLKLISQGARWWATAA